VVLTLATKKKNQEGRARRGSKAGFVLGLAPETPAKEVVAEAKKHGIELTEKYVYVIRSNAKRKNAGRGVGGAVRGRARFSNGSTQEADLRRAIAELGLSRARQVFKEVEAAFGPH
jgi:hypothetical protein